jgi:hypothetical protein
MIQIRPRNSSILINRRKREGLNKMNALTSRKKEAV